MVANEFIDRYMAVANGEYVKVYLYVLRHQDTEVTVSRIADALDHTEGDVRRALAYWVRLGVLAQEREDGKQNECVHSEKAVSLGGMMTPEPGASDIEGHDSAEGFPCGSQAGGAEQVKAERVPVVKTESGKERTRYTPEQVGRLAKESEFTQLLYISQKYMNKVFTPKECEVFAYLYDGLHMPVELLEYLVEYCVQGDHTSIRYLETVALNWHEQGINTVDKARQHTAAFSTETFSVMKAFGLSDRRPGDTELAAIQRWFKEWGFSKELVLEACGRTLKATHKPSFSYADKILAEWRKAGVKTMADVKKQDARRESRKPAHAAQGSPTAVRASKNQFHNFEQRDTNYDTMVLERLKKRLGEG